ncbi:MAG: threonyl-tRNA synthetase editing domain-containing protein [Methanohalobium sp.]|uniref:threonyl-tRNA synthetase editing domain-containing protein n=1 Tax=Methanohalobium sp. TaxID=2837493 RepID=UPI00397974F1
MKMLLFDTEYFWYDTYSKTLENVEDVEKQDEIKDTTVVFIHAESEDEKKTSKVLKKALKNIKWYLNKVGKEKIVLHSFAHLSSSVSTPEFAEQIIHDIESKLKDKEIEVYTTPFGYFSEFSIHVRGESIAKTFKEI